MNIIYIVYTDINEIKSGSSVRPRKMLDTFKKMGIDVELLSTQQNRYVDRCKAVYKFIKKIKNKKYDFCYIELPSGPIFGIYDIFLLQYINKCGIEIGMFYRDALWLFDDENVLLPKYKKVIINILHKRDIRLFKKIAKKIYVPSASFATAFYNETGALQLDVLPPGTDLSIKTHYKKTQTGIYVGSSSYKYGLADLIEAYRRLNEMGYKFKLIVVTRKFEYKTFFPNGHDYPWLEIKHVEGENLTPLYSKSDLAFIPIKKNKYTDMALAIKMLEYISFEKPIITNSLKETGEFLKKYDCALIYNESIEELMSRIVDFYENNLGIKLYENIVTAKNQNSWETRVSKIINDLKNK